MKIVSSVMKHLQKNIDNKNKKRLTNYYPTLVCSNCLGGFLYHWLGLQFRSPFINLYMTPEDFITALGDFRCFIDTPAY